MGAGATCQRVLAACCDGLAPVPGVLAAASKKDTRGPGQPHRVAAMSIEGPCLRGVVASQAPCQVLCQQQSRCVWLWCVCSAAVVLHGVEVMCVRIPRRCPPL